MGFMGPDTQGYEVGYKPWVLLFLLGKQWAQGVPVSMLLCQPEGEAMQSKRSHSASLSNSVLPHSCADKAMAPHSSTLAW